jgi:hypothetical protein
VRRLTLLWAVLVFVVSALTGTTTASASAVTYDTPPGARVDLHENEGAVARLPAFSGVREWSAPPAVEVQAASTTPSGSFVATEAVDDLVGALCSFSGTTTVERVRWGIGLATAR